MPLLFRGGREPWNGCPRSRSGQEVSDWQRNPISDRGRVCSPYIYLSLKQYECALTRLLFSTCSLRKYRTALKQAKRKDYYKLLNVSRGKSEHEERLSLMIKEYCTIVFTFMYAWYQMLERRISRKHTRKQRLNGTLTVMQASQKRRRRKLRKCLKILGKPTTS